MVDRRKIGFFTGNRAEYGLLLPVIRAVNDHPGLEALLIVAGAHLQEGPCGTIDEIEADGTPVSARVPLRPLSDTLTATAMAIGEGIVSLAPVWERLAPDIAVVYGDRYEAFAAAIAATQIGLPLAHLEGGDHTEGGALDDSVRHAITKLAHLHFPTNPDSARRIVEMGESKKRVFTTGFPALDTIAERDYLSASEAVDRYGIDLARPFIIFTQHSVATEADQALAQLEPSLHALAQLAQEGVQVIATHPNDDAGGQRMRHRLDAWSQEVTSLPVQVHPSLGRRGYHGLLALTTADTARGACAGNSSSGIKETPVFGCPTVDIGTRQKGRLRAENTVQVDYDADAIETALRQALFDDGHRAACLRVQNPYGTAGVGVRIAKVLSEITLGTELTIKSR